MKLHFTQIKIRLFWFLSVSVKTDHLPHFHVNFCVIVEIVEKCFFFLCKCSISKLKKKTTTKGTDSSSLCRPFGIVLQHEWVHCPWGLCCVCDCSLLNQTKRKERSTQLHFLFLICYRKKKEEKKKTKLPFECPVSYRSRISATTKDFVPQVPPNAQGGSHLCEQIHEILWKGQARKGSVLQREVSEQGSSSTSHFT